MIDFEGVVSTRSRSSLVPILLRSGVRLLDHLGPDPIALEQTTVIGSEGVTRLRG